MEFLANGLAIIAASVAAIYCMVLSRRLAKLNRLDTGMGASIAALAQQSADLQATLNAARSAGETARSDMVEQTARAERAAGRLELLLATLHDSSTGQATPVKPKAASAAGLSDVYKAMR